MADPWNLTNYCYCDDWLQGSNYGSLVCHTNHGTHNRDPIPQSQNPSTHGPGWSNLQSRYPYDRVVDEPDTWDYSGFLPLYPIMVHW
jgi:hypothetical protein